MRGQATGTGGNVMVAGPWRGRDWEHAPEASLGME